MTSQKSVAWVDGILVKPQHFEQQERAWQQRLNSSLNRFSPYGWGISQCQINEDLLTHNKIQLTKCNGWFQDGTEFNLDANALQRLSMDIEDNVNNETLYLCLPLNETLSEQYDANKRYFVEEIEVVDTLEPSAAKVPILVRDLNVCLLTEQQNREAYASIPVLSIKKAGSDGGIVLDENFIPPCLSVNNNEQLSSTLRAVLVLLERKQKQLSRIVAAPLQSKYITSITDIALLQVVNRNIAQLYQYQAVPMLHPFTLYQFFAVLLAELSTFYNENRIAILASSYQHQNLSVCFSAIKQQLFEILQMKFEHQVSELKLLEQNNNIFSTNVEDSALFKDSDFILGVRNRAGVSANDVKQLVKIASVENISDVVHLQLPGVQLERLSLVPPQLPYHEDMVYLRLIKQGERWQNIKDSNSIALYINEKIKNSTFNLWTIPELAGVKESGL